MSLSRVLVTTKVTLTHQFSLDEVPTDAGAGMVVTVTRLDGTVVGTPASPATDIGDGLYSFDLPVSADLDTWLVDWSGLFAGATVTVRDVVEIVGSFIFEVTRARSTLRLSATVYPTATLAEKRITVEDEAELIAGRTFVPRFTRLLLDGSGTSEITTPHLDLRRVRAAKVAARAGGTFTALTADELAAVAPLPEGILARDDGGIWPYGRRNVIVEYEYGMDAAPPGVRDMAIVRLRHHLDAPTTTIPERALSYTIADGGVYRLAAEGPRSTGYPNIDAAYKRYQGVPAGAWIAG